MMSRRLVGATAAAAILCTFGFLAFWLYQNGEDVEQASMDQYMDDLLDISTADFFSWYAPTKEAIRLLAVGSGIALPQQLNPWLDAVAADRYSVCLLYDRVSDNATQLAAWEAKALAINTDLTAVNLRANMSALPVHLVTAASTSGRSAVGLDITPVRGATFQRLEDGGVVTAVTPFRTGVTTGRSIIIAYRGINASDPLASFVSCSLNFDDLVMILDKFTSAHITVQENEFGDVVGQSVPCDPVDSSTYETQAVLAGRSFTIFGRPCQGAKDITRHDDRILTMALVLTMGVVCALIMFITNAFFDVLKRREVKATRLQAEQRTLLEVLSYIYHELRNPLHIASNAMVYIQAALDGASSQPGAAESKAGVGGETDWVEATKESLLQAEEVLNSMHELQVSLRRTEDDAIDFDAFMTSLTRRWGRYAYTDTSMRVCTDKAVAFGTGPLVRINQLITMGMSNALKYCKPGGRIDLWASMRTAKDDRIWMLYLVSNDVKDPVKSSSFLHCNVEPPSACPDLPELPLPEGVGKWRQETTSKQRKGTDAGSGFGLTVARSVATSVGGFLKTTVTCVDNHIKAHYMIGVPLGSYNRNESLDKFKQHAGWFAEATVVLVDDFQPNIDDITKTLVILGFKTHNITSFTRPAEALAYMRANPPPTFVLLDMWMPGMTGDEFAQAINDIPTNKVFVTASARGTVFHTILPIVYKPVQASALAKVLLDLLDFVAV